MFTQQQSGMTCRIYVSNPPLLLDTWLQMLLPGRLKHVKEMERNPRHRPTGLWQTERVPHTVHVRLHPIFIMVDILFNKLILSAVEEQQLMVA